MAQDFCGSTAVAAPPACAARRQQHCCEQRGAPEVHGELQYALQCAVRSEDAGDRGGIAGSPGVPHQHFSSSPFGAESHGEEETARTSTCPH